MPNGTSQGPPSIVSDVTEHVGRSEVVEYKRQTVDALQDSVRSTLGPRGMDKMLTDGDRIVVTNHGSTILAELEVNNPIGELLLAVANTQRESVGDGTTTAMLYATELLSEAFELLESGISPAAVVRGYELACQRALTEFRTVGWHIEDTDGSVESLVDATITTGGGEGYHDHFRDLVVAAITRTQGEPVDASRIQVTARADVAPPSSIEVPGSILTKPPVHESMPTEFDRADVLVLGSKETLEVDDDRVRPDIVADADTYEHVHEFERSQREQMLEQIRRLEPDLVVTQRGIDDILGDKLARDGILAVRGFGSPDPVAFLAAAVGANVITHLSEARTGDLGRAAIRRIDEDHIAVTSERSSRSTILVSGWTDQSTGELERLVEGAVRAVTATIQDGRVLPGAGAVESAGSRAIRSDAASIEGREQLAADAFADAIEIVPRTLAENAGRSPLDAMTELRAAHDDGDETAGVSRDGFVDESIGERIPDSSVVKRSALRRATDVVNRVLRVDEIFGVNGLSTKAPEDDMERAPRPWEMA